MKIIVTGGAGFIGSHLVDYLVNKKHKVIVIDNFSTGLKDNLKLSQSKIKIINKDISLNQNLNKIFKGVDYVFHLAGLASMGDNMWAILKFDKKNFEILKQNFTKTLGGDLRFYRPKILLHKYKKNKLVAKEVDLLGDYLICFHNKFSDKNIIQNLKFKKGVKYFLNNFRESQKEISDFVNNCKQFENNKGYIVKSFVHTEINTFYKFLTGPFTNKIFKLVGLDKNKISILLENFNTKIDKRDFLFSRV